MADVSIVAQRSSRVGKTLHWSCYSGSSLDGLARETACENEKRRENGPQMPGFDKARRGVLYARLCQYGTSILKNGVKRSPDIENRTKMVYENTMSFNW